MLDLRSSDVLITIAVATFLSTHAQVIPVIPTVLRVRVGLSPEECTRKIPPIRGEQSLMPATEQKWISILLSLYAAALLVPFPPLGYLADWSSSRQLPLLQGLLALAGSISLVCVETTVGLCAAGRFFQGLSAAVVWVVGFALIRDTIPPEEFGRVSGILGMASRVGSMTMPLLGGILYQRGGYCPVYGLAFGLISVDVVLRFLLIEERQAATWPAGPEVHLGSLCEPSTTGGAHTSADLVVPVHSSGWRLTSLLLRSPRLGSVLGGYLVIALIQAYFNTVLPLRRSSRLFTGGPMIISIPLYVLLRLVARSPPGQKVMLLAVCLPPLVLEVSREVSRMEERDPSLFSKGGATAQAYGMLSSAWATGNLVGPYLAGYVRQAAGWDTIPWVLGLIAGITAVPHFPE
ncbi:major facilitator superfamily domain-containing protein [Aspergillus keveii]|uniref:Major facilitator superfamily domain-containing protein n=1 Tax=Aspergillus keveii TaxID=714993 RepID=A0ABR4GDB9_9EURO